MTGRLIAIAKGLSIPLGCLFATSALFYFLPDLENWSGAFFFGSMALVSSLVAWRVYETDYRRKLRAPTDFSVVRRRILS